MEKATVILQDAKPTQGEKLMILALYEKERLTMKVIQNASAFFGVPPDYFEEDTTLREVLQRLNSLEKDRQSRITENRELREEIIILKAEIIKMRREKDPGEEKHLKHN